MISQATGLDIYNNPDFYIPEEEEIIPKKLLIFVLHVDVKSMSEMKAGGELARSKAMMKKFAYDIERYSKYKVSYMVLPSRDGDSDLKCIFPSNQENIDLSFLDNKLSEENLLP